jgi:endonuclease G, mitochondrial
MNDSSPTRDDNMGMGNPSGANTTDENNYILPKPQFIISYNRGRGSANWTSWHLSQAWKGDATRQDNFRPDDTLPSGWFRATTQNYTNTGFDRGHLCPSDDRDGTQSDNDATFTLTNIAPQAPNCNRGPWEELEAYSRKIAEAGNELYIVAGINGIGGSGSNGGKNKSIADGNIAVAEFFWKVILVLPVGKNDVTRVDETTRVIAVKMPNNQSSTDLKWGDYRLSIKDLEDLTGYDFLSNVPTEIQKKIEGRKDDGPTVKVSFLRTF